MSDVRNNTRSHRFELEINDEIAKAWYRKQGNVVTFTHTDVPDSLAGQGVASRLARGALEQVRAAGDKIAATCPFFLGFLKRHHEYDDLLAEPVKADKP